MRTIGPGIHVHEQDFSMMGLEIGTRMTLIELGHEIWIHSPVRIDDALATAVERLGPPTHLVAPSAVHHLFIGDWKKRYPGAKMFGPQALVKKRKDLTFDQVLLSTAPPEWEGAIDQQFLEGVPYLGEFAFLHRKSRTLILTDQLLYFHDRAWPVATRLATRLIGAHRRPVWPRDFGLFVKDKAALAAALEVVLAWDFDRIVISHGDIVETDGKAALRTAYRAILG